MLELKTFATYAEIILLTDRFSRNIHEHSQAIFFCESDSDIRSVKLPISSTSFAH